MTQPIEQSDAASAQQWYLTVPHRQVNRRPAPGERSSDIDDHPLELPFGVAHVRRVGAPFIACGRHAQYWPISWLLDISEVDVICPECANAVQ
jgi:hypothetical protein